MNEREVLYIFLKWKQLNQQARDARLCFCALTANYIFFLAKAYGFIVHIGNTWNISSSFQEFWSTVLKLIKN